MPYILLDPAVAKAAPVVTLGSPRTSYGKSLATMRANLLLRLRNRKDVYNPDSPSYTMLDSWINDAYLDVATATDYVEQTTSFALVTDIDQMLYLLPANVTVIRGVTLQNVDHPAGGFDLEPITLDAFRSTALYEGAPLEFLEYDANGSKMLVLHPLPDEAFTLAVTAMVEPLPLTDPTHCPYIDRQFHEGIELLARVKAHSALSEAADTALAHNEFLAFMQRRTSKKELRDADRRPGSSYPRNKYQLRHRVIKSPEDY